jgi:ATP-dependent 26S proteasome regulatory subunit
MGHYQHIIIIIMTTNKELDWFDKQDSSLMRNGRVDIKKELILDI